jgi:hypothetical protein
MIEYTLIQSARRCGEHRMADLKKLDTGLLLALRAYEESPDTGDAASGISISLRFEGDLAAIEALGERHA